MPKVPPHQRHHKGVFYPFSHAHTRSFGQDRRGLGFVRLVQLPSPDAVQDPSPQTASFPAREPWMALPGAWEDHGRAPLPVAVTRARVEHEPHGFWKR